MLQVDSICVMLAKLYYFSFIKPNSSAKNVFKVIEPGVWHYRYQLHLDCLGKKNHHMKDTALSKVIHSEKCIFKYLLKMQDAV